MAINGCRSSKASDATVTMGTKGAGPLISETANHGWLQSAVEPLRRLLPSVLGLKDSFCCGPVGGLLSRVLVTCSQLKILDGRL